MRRIVATLATLLVLAVGCAADDEAAPPAMTTTTTTTSTTTTTTTTVPPEPNDEEQIVALVELYWETVAAALDPPLLDPEMWKAVSTSENLSGVLQDIADIEASGFGVRQLGNGGSLVLGQSKPVVVGETATLRVCLRDSAEQYRIADGEVLETVETIGLHVMELVRVDEDWLVNGAPWQEGFDQGEVEACLATLS